MRLSENSEKLLHKTSRNNPLFLNNTNKETVFSAHFREINQINQTPSITPFRSTFQTYSKRESLIDTIVSSFDVGKFTNMNEMVEYESGREVCAGLSEKIKKNIQDINTFFSKKIYKEPIESSISPLNYESFSFILSLLTSNQQTQISPEVQTVYRPSINPSAPHQNSSSTQPWPLPTVQSKVDLLLHELFSQKQRKQQIQFYQQAIQIKLNEFFQYIVRDDQFLGLSLQGKAEAMVPCLGQLKGQMVDGWPKLQLIQIFFEQLKELQEHRLKLLKIRKGKQDEARSENKSVKSQASSSKRSKYSEPNRGKKLKESEQWMGSLQ